MKTILPFLCAWCLTCCSVAQQTQPEQKNSDKEVVDSLHAAIFTSLMKGDYQVFIDAHSKNCTDLGGGMNGTGKPAIDTVKIRNLSSSPQFLQMKNKMLPDIFDLDKKIIYDYKETREHIKNIDRFDFKLQAGDVYVFYPPRKGGPFPEAWWAIYRKENGVWKIIALD